MSVSLPDGRFIEYAHDPLGRRIAKTVDGIIVEKYLWQGLTRLLAVYDGADNLLMRFEYADGRMPVAVNVEGVTYYLTYDQVGSLRLVADSAGNVIKSVVYDSFGNILSDGNPVFAVPFGFAGGLHDKETGLVRFGYRDYDPDVGRWTAKDPILFAGGDTDLYGYVLNNPLNAFDSLGLSEEDVSKINNTFRSTVDKLTKEGKRHPNSYWNNISRSLYDVSGGRIGSLYLGCGEQAGVVTDALRKNTYDDKWEFGEEKGFEIIFPHQWGEAESDNPSDPKIKYDPWKDEITQ